MIYFNAQMSDYEQVRRRRMRENEERLRARGFNPIITAVSYNFSFICLSIFDIMILTVSSKCN